MAWTTPRTWVTGELVTASLMNTHVRDNLDFLKTERDASPRVLHYNVTPVGNVGTGTDDLMTYSLPASTLAVNGQAVRWTVAGSFANNADNNRIISVVFGATTLATVNIGTFVGSANDRWGADFTIARISGTVQTAVGYLMYRVAGLPFFDTVQCVNGTPGETLSGAVTMKCTAASSIATDNNIVQTFNQVVVLPVVTI